MVYSELPIESAVSTRTCTTITLHEETMNYIAYLDGLSDLQGSHKRNDCPDDSGKSGEAPVIEPPKKAQRSTVNIGVSAYTEHSFSNTIAGRENVMKFMQAAQLIDLVPNVSDRFW